MESELWSGNSKHLTMHTESSRDNGYPIVHAKVSRSSSSSSATSFDRLIDSDDGEKDTHVNSISKSVQNGPSSPKAQVVMLPETSVQTPEWSMVSASPRTGPGPLSPPRYSSQTPEWSLHSASPKQFPPVQTMGRYDPNRIPSSIFASKPANPMEWSVASNESLFSIHMGNNSFSRDHAILLSKYEELTRPDELGNLTSSQQPVTEAKFKDFNKTPSSLPTVIEVAADNHRKSASMGEESAVKEAEEEKPMVIMKETAGEDHSMEITPPAEGARFSTNASSLSDGREIPPADGARISSSTPRLSDESGNSSSSFAFPVLTGEGGRSTSVEVAPECLQSKPSEKLQSQPQDQVVTPKAARTRWFSCCFCHLTCC